VLLVTVVHGSQCALRELFITLKLLGERLIMGVHTYLFIIWKILDPVLTELVLFNCVQLLVMICDGSRMCSALLISVTDLDYVGLCYVFFMDLEYIGCCYSFVTDFDYLGHCYIIVMHQDYVGHCYIFVTYLDYVGLCYVFVTDIDYIGHCYIFVKNLQYFFINVIFYNMKV
jgi:hypothetical protein